ncbi:Serine protease inhibitor 77Ba [Eumeta japonica]|uniref:Serine protease inhibitor 77Ba n=1 Tax=Eumeta variegata TaxID=151549 RepID=A0A4C1YZY8_EUMVA|nr:Serine protease inhibitor 77Ba [Eumeta japonica]
MNYAIGLSDNCRNFSVEISYFTALKDEERSVFLSPFGLWTFLFNIVLGVSGSSAIQLRTAVILRNKNEESLVKHFRDFRNDVLKTNTPDVPLTMKGYIFLDGDFQINSEYYGNITYDAEIVNKVLELKIIRTATNLINSYLSHSQDLILTEKDVHKSRMVMSSSLHFRGQWHFTFNESKTTIEFFYDEHGNITGEVVMMHQRNRFPLANIKEMGAYVLELPFGSRGKYCLLILLPSPGKTVTDVYKTLTAFPIKDIFYRMYNDTQNYENIDVRIPRFRINNDIVLKEPLQNMGVYDIFNQEHADFTRVSNEKIFVSTIKQRADIEVTESGIVSSAVTSAVFVSDAKTNSGSAGMTSDFRRPHLVYRINPPGYIVNKPFLYFVIEKCTVTIVFGGVFLKPSDH